MRTWIESANRVHIAACAQMGQQVRLSNAFDATRSSLRYIAAESLSVHSVPYMLCTWIHSLLDRSSSLD